MTRTFRQETSPTAWKTALSQLSNAHALQSWTWGEFKSRWGWSAVRYALEIEGKPLAAFQILKRRLPRLPFCILYVPKGPALDYNDAALRRVVLAELEAIAAREKAVFIKIDPDVVKSWGLEPERLSPIGAKFVQELKQRGWRFSNEQIQFRNTVEMAVQRPEEELLAAMHSKTRYNIRLAGRKGIVIRQGTPDDFPLIAEMYRETATRDGFTIRPLEYYMDIWQALYEAGMAHPLLAEYEGDPVAAVVLIRSGDRVIYMYGASTHKERKRMPNHLLQWEAIRWAKEQGVETYDFWGAPDEFVETDSMWGVWRFKKGFSGQVVRHIGAWDFVARPAFYWLYTVALPQYLDFLRSKTKNVKPKT
ncbi:MAG: peptidoglycan bridge formation glycyltransferase FemA/FemB family protein [Chloroflexi bacterium]|nr:peptidoglycan bridge formation glycyltransferase FemA/FemB family protein [Chloroflexota bacterium]